MDHKITGNRMHTFNQRSDSSELPSTNQEIPNWLEFLPSRSIEEVFSPMFQSAMM
jgi:hypothetical protein